MNDQQYYFSVVMAVYNTQEYLKEAIDSIVEQDIGFDHIQLIIVNDGSTDGSGLICDDFKDKRFKVFHKKNGGLSSARNLGIKKAKGNILAFVVL